MKAIKIPCTLAAMLMCVTSSTQAASVYVNLTNESNQTGAVNRLIGNDTTTVLTLNDKDNLATTIAVQRTSGNVAGGSSGAGFYANGVSGDAAAAGFTAAMGSSAHESVYYNDRIGVYAFSGLTVGQNYAFTLWGSINQSAVSEALYTLTDGFSPQTATLDGTNGSATTPFSNDSNVVVLNSAPDINGDLTLSFQRAAGSLGYRTSMNAVRIEDVAAIPEPSSSALLGLGGLALIFRRRK